MPFQTSRIIQNPQKLRQNGKVDSRTGRQVPQCGSEKSGCSCIWRTLDTNRLRAGRWLHSQSLSVSINKRFFPCCCLFLLHLHRLALSLTKSPRIDQLSIYFTLLLPLNFHLRYILFYCIPESKSKQPCLSSGPKRSIAAISALFSGRSTRVSLARTGSRLQQNWGMSSLPRPAREFLPCYPHLLSSFLLSLYSSPFTLLFNHLLLLGHSSVYQTDIYQLLLSILLFTFRFSLCLSLISPSCLVVAGPMPWIRSFCSSASKSTRLEHATGTRSLQRWALASPLQLASMLTGFFTLSVHFLLSD